MFKWPSVIRSIGTIAFPQIKYFNRKEFARYAKKEKLDPSHGESAGFAYCDEGKINICTEDRQGCPFTPTHVFVTLVHEVIHIIDQEYTIELTEAETDILAIEITKLVEQIYGQTPETRKGRK